LLFDVLNMSGFTIHPNAFFYLPIETLFQLSSVDKQLNNALEEHNIWLLGIQQALPGFLVSPSLIAKECRSAFLAFVPTLAATNVSGQVALQTMGFAKQLKKVVAEQQRRNGSATNQVTLVNACFQLEGLRNAFKMSPVKHPVVVAASLHLGGPRGESKASTFQLHMAWQCGKPIVCLRDDGIAPDESMDVSQDVSEVMERIGDGSAHLVNIDLKCFHSAMTLNYIQAPLIVNAPTWQPLSSGMFFVARADEAKVCQQVLAPTVFAVSIRDGYPKNNNNLSRMLNLDKPAHQH